MTAAAVAALPPLGRVAKPFAPVAGFMQLLDAKVGVSFNTITVGDNVCTAWNPDAASSQTGGYAQATAGKQPAVEQGPYSSSGPLFGCAPSIRGDGGTDFMTSVNGNFANATMAAANTPFVCYALVQPLDSTDEGWRSFGNSGTASSFWEIYNATTGNKYTISKEDSTGAPGLKTVQDGTNDQLPDLWRIEQDNAGLVNIERNGVQVLAPTNQSVGALVLNQDALFALVRTTASVFGHVRIGRWLWYQKNGETAGEKTQNYRYMRQAFTVPANSSLLITEGDSTSQLQNPWSLQLTLGGVFVWNPAIGTEPLSPNMLSFQKDHVNSVIGAPNFARSCATLYAGSNDLINGRTAAQLATDFQTWAASAVAAVPARKLIAGTIPAASTITGAAETERLAFNTNVRANYLAWGFHALGDRDTALGGTNYPTSGLTYDGVHCNDAGNLIIAQTVTQPLLQGFGF